MDYAFGALDAMVEARREALSAMLPCLAIVARCRIAGLTLILAKAFALAAK
jgi:hypothetical protein